MSTSPDLAVAVLAAAQHGVVSRTQLITAGVGLRTVQRRVARGLLIPVGARTYRLATAPETTRSIVMAACLDRDGVVSHRTGLWLHGHAPEPHRLDITVRRGGSTVSAISDHPRIRIHTSTNLPDDDIVVIDGIPTTSLARSLLGTAALVPHEVTHATLIDDVARAIESGAATMPWLRWILDQRRCRGRAGVLAFEAALDARDRVGPTESWLERHYIDLSDADGLPRPSLQRVVTRTSGRPARVDFMYEGSRLVVEVLGYAHHRTPEQLADDTMRANELQLEGYRVLQLTSRHLAECPDVAMALVARALALPPDPAHPVLARESDTSVAQPRENR